MSKKENKADMPLIIFKTEEDRIKNDIFQMSNFFDGYISQICKAENQANKLQTINETTNINIGLINESIRKMQNISTDEFILIPDLDNLPVDVKEKLKTGEYKIGESKQVNGNMRAVIIDKEKTRVKDITLKKEKNPSVEISNKLDIQIQMKEIFNKLTEIQDMQEYQIELEKNRSMIVPFLDARDKIIEAEEEQNIERRKVILLEANKLIASAVNYIYSDLNTTSKKFINCINNPFKRYLNTKNKFMNYIVSDLQYATKYIGIQLQVLEYLNENTKSKQVLEKYNSVLTDFFTTPKTKNQMTLSDLLQDYYPYNNQNKNMWYNFKKEFTNKKDFLLDKTPKNKDIYIITVNDESEKNDEK